MKKYQIVWVENTRKGRMIEMASSKAPHDVSVIARECGYIDKNIVVPRIKNKLLSVVVRAFRLVRAVRRCDKNSKILLQYPCFNERIFQYVIRFISDRKFVTVVHDMNSIRENGKLSKSEISSLSLFDELIVHTREMEECLKPHLRASVRFHVLGCFPYLTSSVCDTPILGNEVCFAGNIDKSAFLKHLIPVLGNIKLNLYGHMNNVIPLSGNAKYCGVFKPEDISALRGNWGLVWDGDSIMSCSGTWGEYLRIIAPHKFSLYIAAGIPVIVWSQSAMAKIVKDRNIGFVIPSLYDLEHTITSVSQEQYSKMLISVKEFGDNLIRGRLLKSFLLSK